MLLNNPPSPDSKIPYPGGGVLSFQFPVYFPLKKIFRFAEILLIQGRGVYLATEGIINLFIFFKN